MKVYKYLKLLAIYSILILFIPAVSKGRGGESSGGGGWAYENKEGGLLSRVSQMMGAPFALLSGDETYFMPSQQISFADSDEIKVSISKIEEHRFLEAHLLSSDYPALYAAMKKTLEGHVINNKNVGGELDSILRNKLSFEIVKDYNYSHSPTKPDESQSGNHLLFYTKKSPIPIAVQNTRTGVVTVDQALWDRLSIFDRVVFAFHEAYVFSTFYNAGSHSAHKFLSKFFLTDKDIENFHSTFRSKSKYKWEKELLSALLLKQFSEQVGLKGESSFDMLKNLNPKYQRALKSSISSGLYQVRRASQGVYSFYGDFFKRLRWVVAHSDKCINNSLFAKLDSKANNSEYIRKLSNTISYPSDADSAVEYVNSLYDEAPVCTGIY